MIIFWCIFCFGRYFGVSSLPSHWARIHWLSYKVYFSSHKMICSRNTLLLLHRIGEDNPSKKNFFFLVSSWGQHLLSFFTFPICFKGPMTIGSMLSSSATSHAVVRRSASMIALSWLLSTSNGWSLRSSSSRLYFLCKTCWTTTALYVH